MRGLHTFESARLFMDGWLVHYNFLRPQSLNDLTPAQAAGIRFPFRNWKDIIEQPYHVTARIPILRQKTKSVTQRKRKRARSKKVLQPSVTSVRQARK